MRMLKRAKPISGAGVPTRAEAEELLGRPMTDEEYQQRVERLVRLQPWIEFFLQPWVIVLAGLLSTAISVLIFWGLKQVTFGE